MSATPLFSVVIPTRNRGRLVRWALQSALSQTFSDYELVVSDNCSQDNTPDVVRQYAGSDVRYVRVKEGLSIADHWEFAFNQARGKYVTFLCDDDGWCPDMLERVADIVQKTQSPAIASASAVYFGDNWMDAPLRNSVYFTQYSRRVEQRNSRDTLKQLFTCKNTNEAPRMLNSFCDRNLVNQIQRKAGRVFLPSCQDYSFATLVTASTPTWTFIDEPLRIEGAFAEGIGFSGAFNRGEPLQQYVREFGNIKLLDRTPLETPILNNFIANTLLLCKDLLPDELRDFEIDWLEYFTGCWTLLLSQERNGVDISIDREEFHRVLAQQPAALQEKVKAGMEQPGPAKPVNERQPNQETSLIRRVLNQSITLSRLEAKLRGGEIVAPRTIFGSAAGFGSIAECARLLPDLNFSVPR